MAKYTKKRVKHICDLISKDSYTIAEICSLSKINIDTYYDWLKNKPEFSEAINKAKEAYDQLLVREAKKSMMKKIQGYTVDEAKTVFEPKDKANPEAKPRIKEQTIIKKHYQPDSVLIMFALTNKASEEFKNKHSTEVTGKDGAPLVPKITIEVINSPDQVKKPDEIIPRDDTGS